MTITTEGTEVADYPHVTAYYERLSNKPVATTKEIIPDTLLVDYDADGEPVGIEIIAPICNPPESDGSENCF